MTRQKNQIYDFGPFNLVPAEKQLVRDGQPVQLTPKAFDLLVVLVENSGHLVEKSELLSRVWPDSFVEEANLSVKMSELRRALGETSNANQYIETVPRRGYRFVAEVIERSDEQNADQPSDEKIDFTEKDGERRPARRWLWPAGIVGLLVIGGLLYFLNVGALRKESEEPVV